jgi:mannobiose 2-epimerase
MALTEIGKVPDVEKMWRFGVRWSHFVSWTGDLGPQEVAKDDLTRIYKSDLVLNREELKPVTVASAQTVQTATTLPPNATSYGHLASEVENNLEQHVLSKWFPAATDRERGGFYQNFAEDWTRLETTEKSIVYQSRLTWIAAQEAMRSPQTMNAYREYSRHGLKFLRDVLWDKQHGGFFWAVDRNAQPATERGREKHVYGISFGIYAAAANYKATRDAQALNLAQRAFQWLDAHAHDARNGGYYEALTSQGQLILVPPVTPSGLKVDAIGTRYGYKSMNSHIHLLEAFTALYEVWPDRKLRARLQETFNIVRDKIVVEQVGAMNLYFTPDWRALPDHDSFGHDVETAYLLVEAAAALGKPNDARTWNAARRLVDHALEFGWDTEHGGFYDAGSAFGKPTNTDKIWWTQAEGLNALLLMHERFGKQTPRYWQAFVQQWNFIKQHQIDPVHGGWYPSVTREGSPPRARGKSDGWTEAYHQGRALINVSRTLRLLASAKPAH